MLLKSVTKPRTDLGSNKFLTMIALVKVQVKPKGVFVRPRFMCDIVPHSVTNHCVNLLPPNRQCDWALSYCLHIREKCSLLRILKMMEKGDKLHWRNMY